MITLHDGPGRGQRLLVRRAPPLLRVVRDTAGKWRALAELHDRPQKGDRIFIYRRRDDITPTKYFQYTKRDERGKGLEGGWYWNAAYNFIADQPLDHHVRGTEAWRDWATLHAEAINA